MHVGFHRSIFGEFHEGVFRGIHRDTLEGFKEEFSVDYKIMREHPENSTRSFSEKFTEESPNNSKGKSPEDSSRDFFDDSIEERPKVSAREYLGNSTKELPEDFTGDFTEEFCMDSLVNSSVVTSGDSPVEFLLANPPRMHKKHSARIP